MKELEENAVKEVKDRLQYLQFRCITRDQEDYIGSENDKRKKRNRPIINELLNTLKEYEL